MKCRYFAALCFAFCCGLCCGLVAEAAEKGPITTLDAASKTTPLETVDQIATMDQRVIIDPVTGETRVVKVDSRTKTGDASSPTQVQDVPAEEPQPLLPYDHFDPSDETKAMLNSYLLSQLSMKVYSGATSEAAFRQHLIDQLEPQGIAAANIQVKMNNDTGTELAAFTIGDNVVIAFRGTSSEGTTNINPFIDAITDLNDDPWPIEINKKQFFVHLGFWDSVDSVYPWVLARALEAHQANKTVWLTGHSLGAARATLAAMRLHYADEIPVDGLMTFGSPKVGDENFAAFCYDHGTCGWSLQEVTTRFVVNGDPATTFPEKEQIGINFFTGWVYYKHIGNPITIYPFDNGSDFMTVPGENFFKPTEAQWIGFLTGAGHSEHMWYDDALLEAVTEDDQFNSIEITLLEFQSVVQ